ncbi:MAG: glutathione S-transferase family protein [Pseudomonadota bacterium]
MSSWRLYNRVGSGGMVVEAALVMAQIPFELEELPSKPGTPLTDEFRTVNPWAQLPTLVSPDGETLTECAAILIHLAAVAPERRLGPAPGTAAHGQLARWLVFTSVNVYEGVLRRGYSYRFTDDPNGHEAVKSAAIRRLREAFAVLEQAVESPYFLGESMTVLDVYVAMLWLWAGAERESHPRLEALTNRVRRDAVVGPVWRKHFGSR